MFKTKKYELVTLDDESLKRLQKIELDMLCELDRICRKYDINYCIYAGTMLGAVRHGGFIPWDDDIDVAMLRPEYEKFLEACRNELDPQKYFFQDYRTDKNYFWGFGKIRRIGTDYITFGREHLKGHTGVWIDVFPMDSIPDNRIEAYVHSKCCFAIRKIMYARVGCKVEKSIFARLWYRLLSIIPRSVLFCLYEKLISVDKDKKTKLVRIATFPIARNQKGGYKREWFESKNEVVFEGKSFFGVSNPDEYLTFKCGDYMSLPPPEKRKKHLASKIDLGDFDI